MTIYFTIFFISTFFFWIEEKVFKNRWNVASLLGLIILGLFAAFRGEKVGTDTEVYLHIYNVSQEARDYAYAAIRISAEPSIYYLSRLSSYFSGFSTLCFIYQFLSATFIYLAAYKYRRYLDVWIVMCLYCFFILGMSFNIMRQVLAMSIIFYGSTFLPNKPKLYFMWTIVGATIHMSSIIASLFIFTLYKILFESGHNRKLYISLYCLGLLAILLCFYKITSLLVNSGVGFLEYYSSNYGESRKSYVSITELLYRFAILFIVLLCFHKDLINRKYLVPYYLLFITEIGLMLLGLYNNFLVRVSSYFLLYQLFILSFIVNSKKLTKASRIVSKTLLIIAGALYWYWTIYHNGTNEVVPYYVG